MVNVMLRTTRMLLLRLFRSCERGFLLEKVQMKPTVMVRGTGEVFHHVPRLQKR